MSRGTLAVESNLSGIEEYLGGGFKTFIYSDRPNFIEISDEVDYIEVPIGCYIYTHVPVHERANMALKHIEHTDVIFDEEEYLEGAVVSVSKSNKIRSDKVFTKGVKYDGDKNRYDLLPWDGIDKIAEVLTFGAKKYDDNNWIKVDNAENRYFAAAMRHLVAWKKGEKTDPESGISHLAHAGACLLFLDYFDGGVE